MLPSYISVHTLKYRPNLQICLGVYLRWVTECNHPVNTGDSFFGETFERFLASCGQIAVLKLRILFLLHFATILVYLQSWVGVSAALSLTTVPTLFP